MEFANTINDRQTLAKMLDLPLDFAEKVGDFALKVPQKFVKKMQKGDMNDPLLLQILPTAAETVQALGFVADPLAEKLANPTKGVIHKYRSRVLIPITGACMVHCRYCFRQHFDYQENLPTTNDWQTIVDYIVKHPEVNEVILSGGDPLSLSDRRLFAILDILESLSQICTIRLHSRVPVVIPSRLHDALLQRLSSSRCQIVLVIHANHPNELDDETVFYFKQAKLAQITLLNQTVLLKNINNNADVLATLSEKLWQAGVLPYYLHVLDKVAGASHFYIDDEQAVAIYWQLLEKCAGYLVPKLVRETPNEAFKTPLNLYAKNS
nr:EF-P beta-lysylation protein EpmB [Moraxella macacae]